MIPADRWHDNGDGTAWLVSNDGWIDNYRKMRSLVERGGDLLRLHHLDRPCDTCDGTGRLPSPWSPEDFENEVCRCPDCIDGRHTFDIEVQGSCDWLREEGRACPACVSRGSTCSPTYRVSVVPGMVLPIVGRSGDGNGQPHIVRRQLWQGDHWHYTFMLNDGTSVRSVTLPPAAQPGMWAVLLKVAS